MKVVVLLGLLIFVSSLLCLEESVEEGLIPVSETVKRLLNKILDEQRTKNETSIPFDSKYIGLWPSHIHINFVGDPKRAFLRNDISSYDNNMFVGAWITELLLEANAFSIIELPSTPLNLSIQSLLYFRDKNYLSPSTIYSFWPQLKHNDVYSAYAVNMVAMFEFLNVNMTSNSSQVHAFFIPGDFDDSSVSLSISSSLYQQRDQYSSIADQWFSDNFLPPSSPSSSPFIIDDDQTMMMMTMMSGKQSTSPSSSSQPIGGDGFNAFINALKSYAYQPFSSDVNINTIDPRTYYWIEPFLSLVYNRSIEGGWNANLTLIPTWVLDLNINRQTYANLYSMPFNVNNVDASVVANTIYALTRAILTNPTAATEWFDTQLQRIYYDSASLLSWVIETEILNERPDIVLLYYMGNYNYYWFVSRSYSLLASSPSPLPFQVLEDVRSMFQTTLQNNATSILLDAVQINGKNAYWDNFIGVNDTTDDWQPLNRADDRLCTTSVAVDTLINIWSRISSSSPQSNTKRGTKGGSGECKIEFEPNTPQEVHDVISYATSFLNSEILRFNYRKENAFFSGSVKGNDLPFFYPMNYIQYLNGTDVPSYSSLIDIEYINNMVIPGMSGYVPESQYASMVNDQRWFGEKTPTVWEGYNVSSNGSLIYWSAPSLTYATTLLALGKSLQFCPLN